MPVYKASLLFSFVTEPAARAVASAHAGGWSEQVWANGTPFNPGNGSAWARARARILPREAQIIGMRQQAYEIVGNKLVPGGANTTPLSYPGMNGITINNPQSAINLRMTTAGAPNVGRYTCRAFPDEFMTNGEFNGLPIAVGLLEQLIREISKPGIGFIGRNLAGVSSSCMGSDGTSMIVANAGAFVVGQMLRFVKIHNGAGESISGVFQIAALPGNNKVTFVGGAGKDAVPGGTVRVDSIAFFQSASGQIGRASVRKVGRPFGGYVGRRSKRRRAS